MDEQKKAEDLILVEKAQKGDWNALETLILRYAWLASKYSRSYFLKHGGEKEDLIQEGMIGIWRAIIDFDSSKHDNFLAFAGMCVSSRIKDTLRKHNRAKNMPLNKSESLNSFDENIAPEYVGDPIANYIEKEGTESFYEKLKNLCKEEHMTVLKYYMEGYSYNEIAAMLDLPVKKIDNILSGIKSKIKKNKEMFI